jgi:N-acetylmuramoyl-L-alanine amidase
MIAPALLSVPDSPLVADLLPSPNIEPRFRALTPTILILHYTGLETVERALDVLSRPDCKVSCHYVVDVDGRVIQMVAEEMRAWHAGLSSWHGETDINSASIGIEIQNGGHALGYPDFPEAQMRAVIALSRDICHRHGIAPERVLAHSDIAPARKIDPGEKFDWARLAAEGVGYWLPAEPVDRSDAGVGPGADGEEIAEARLLLARFGYGVAGEGPLDEELGFVLRAFQLHFRPARVDRRLDRSTLVTLRRLVEALPVAEVA